VPGLAPLDELGRLGVRRLSAGEGVHRVALSAARRCARELLETGRSDALVGDVVSYGEMNQLFSRE
jgi:2-methylisocitrate lyase-like PEP mutase family enzyme